MADDHILEPDRITWTPSRRRRGRSHHRRGYYPTDSDDSYYYSSDSDSDSSSLYYSSDSDYGYRTALLPHRRRRGRRGRCRRGGHRYRLTRQHVLLNNSGLGGFGVGVLGTTTTTATTMAAANRLVRPAAVVPVQPRNYGYRRLHVQGSGPETGRRLRRCQQQQQQRECRSRSRRRCLLTRWGRWIFGDPRGQCHCDSGVRSDCCCGDGSRPESSTRHREEEYWGPGTHVGSLINPLP